MPGEQSIRGVAILAVGAALVALFLAAALIGALGHSIPQELWASAGALAGALVGVLVPSPRVPTKPSAADGATAVNQLAVAAAVSEAQKVAPEHQLEAVQAIRAVAQTAAVRLTGTAADQATTAAARHAEALKTATDADSNSVTTQIKKSAAAAATAELPAALDTPSTGAWGWRIAGEIAKPTALAVIAFVAFLEAKQISDGHILYAHCPAASVIGAAAPCVAPLFQLGTASSHSERRHRAHSSACSRPLPRRNEGGPDPGGTGLATVIFPAADGPVS